MSSSPPDRPPAVIPIAIRVEHEFLRLDSLERSPNHSASRSRVAFSEKNRGEEARSRVESPDRAIDTPALFVAESRRRKVERRASRLWYVRGTTSQRAVDSSRCLRLRPQNGGACEHCFAGVSGSRRLSPGWSATGPPPSVTCRLRCSPGASFHSAMSSTPDRHVSPFIASSSMRSRSLAVIPEKDFTSMTLRPTSANRS